MLPESVGKYVLRTVTDPLTIEVYKKLAGLFAASTKLSPSILLNCLDAVVVKTVWQDHTKHIKSSKKNKLLNLEVCIQIG